MKTIILCICMILVTSKIFSAESYTLRPFYTDGCSGGVLDEDYLFGIDYVSCCIQHDVAYWKGGTKKEKILADKELKQCITEKTNPVYGVFFEIGVAIGGGPELPTPWRWGYGWYPNRPYSELSRQDLKQVDDLQPLSIEGLVIPGEQNSVKVKFESLTGNLCLDKVYEYISPLSMFLDISYFSYVDTSFGSKATVQIEQCEGEISFFYNANKHTCASGGLVGEESQSVLQELQVNLKNCKELSAHQLRKTIKVSQ